jgi:hypothetical protein
MPPFPYSAISSSRDPALPVAIPATPDRTRAKGQKGFLHQVSRRHYAVVGGLLLLSTIVLASLLSGANESNAVMRKGLHELAIQLKTVDHLVQTRLGDDGGRETALSDRPSSIRGIIRKQISTVESLLTQHSELQNQSHSLQIQISKVRHRSLDNNFQDTTRVSYLPVRTRPVPFEIVYLGLMQLMHNALTRDA